MRIKRADLSRSDWEQCRLYVDKMKREGFPAHESWEYELKVWAADPQRLPRKSTIAKLRIRIRFPEQL